MAAGKCLRRYGGHWPHGGMEDGGSDLVDLGEGSFICMCFNEDNTYKMRIFFKNSWTIRWINPDYGKGIASLGKYFSIKGYSSSWLCAEDETLAEVWEGKCTSDCQEYKSGFGGIIGNQSSNPS